MKHLRTFLCPFAAGFGWRSASPAAVVLMASISTSGGASGEPPRAIRSVTDVRARIPDEHDRPYTRETQSHRGFEIREPQYTVIATTSRADARFAAGHVAAAWQNAAELTRRWTDVAAQPDFGLGSLQVVIDDQPLRQRDAPLTTLNVVGLQTQVLISVAPGRPALAQQVLQVREGAAFAMLHAAGIDAAVPAWVAAGLASHAARSEWEQPISPAANIAAEPPPLGGQAWRFERGASDRLQEQPLDVAQAADRVEFLLTGHDARHAPALIDAMAAATRQAASHAARGGGFASQSGSPQVSDTNSAFNRLIASTQADFQTWQKEKLAGQPVYKPAAGLDAETIARQRDMLVLLKLQRRLSKELAATSGTRAKVVSFNKEQGQVAESVASAATTWTMHELAARLTAPESPPWATIDASGDLLFSSDRERLNELLGHLEQRYRIEHAGPKPVLVERLPSGQALRGWLDENAQQPLRPLAKFEVIAARPKGKQEKPPASRQVRAGR